MEQPIPEPWKNMVCEILRSGDKKRINVTLTATQDWFSTFPQSFSFELPLAIADALSQPGIVGASKTMDQPCDAYAFFFTFEARKIFGKVGLTPDGKVVIIFSAHAPRKGDQL